VAVSWLIPVRDGRRWLAEALASALSECGPSDEVIVVDDGSTDGSRQTAPSDPRIRWHSQPPLGIVAALEAGRKMCIHPLIARLDADDIALPGRIAVQRKFLTEHPDIAVVGGRAHIVADDGPVPEGMRRYVDWVNGLVDLHAQLLVESPIFHPAALMRAAAVGAVGGYREGDLPEDYDLWLRLTSAGHKIANVEQAVVRIRDRPERLTRTDARYRAAAFDSVRRDWLTAGPFREKQRVAVWGAGKTGRSWIRWLLAEGHRVEAVIDAFHNTERQGVPIIPPEGLAQLDVDRCLVAVGARGAREQIRAQISAIRPDWKEGLDWWAVR
jgi:glycosyltransferase involved in cell wall biosynthesis